MGCICSKATALGYYRHYRNYYAAGIHFTDSKTILAGAQPRKIVPFISGFGGMKETEDANSIVTAFRETVEELLGIKLKAEFIYRMIDNLGLIPIMQKDNDHYVYYVLDYESLVFIIEYVLSHYDTAYYKRLPTTVYSVIEERWPPANAEVTRIYKLDLVAEADAYSELPLDHYFKKDMEMIRRAFASANKN